MEIPVSIREIIEGERASESVKLFAIDFAWKVITQEAGGKMMGQSQNINQAEKTRKGDEKS